MNIQRGMDGRKDRTVEEDFQTAAWWPAGENGRPAYESSITRSRQGWLLPTAWRFAVNAVAPAWGDDANVAETASDVEFNHRVAQFSKA